MPNIDNPEWTAADIKQAVRLGALPESLQTKIGRPAAATVKIPISIRLDADVLAALKATGKGWQTRINDTMRAALLPRD